MAHLRRGNPSYEYFLWLLDYIDIDEEYQEKYEKLYYQLFKTEYTWYLPGDENRAEDGIELREHYIRNVGLEIDEDDDFRVDEPKVLEVLVALAYRIEIDIMGEPGEDNPSSWFHLMMGNLSLYKFDDDHYSEETVDEILRFWMEGRYDEDRIGSLFPKKSVQKPSKLVELPKQSSSSLDTWGQMCEYLVENF